MADTEERAETGLEENEKEYEQELADEVAKACDDEVAKACDDEAAKACDDEVAKACDDEVARTCDDEAANDDQGEEFRDSEAPLRLWGKLKLKLRKPGILICVLLAITALLEIFVFNFRYFTTLSSSPIELTHGDAVYGDGLMFNSDGSFGLLEAGERTIEFTGLDVKIDSVFLGIINIDFNNMGSIINDEKQNVSVSFSVTDEANELYYQLPPPKDINRSIEKSAYTVLHTSGKSDSLKIHINGQPGERYAILGLVLNPNRPFFFSPVRCLIVFLVLLLFAVGASSYYNWRAYNPKSLAQRAVTLAVAAAVCALFVMMILANKFWHNSYHGHTTHYIELTDALMDGHAYLDAEPPQFLKDMDNPYDSDYRSMLAGEAGAEILWDHAYYNGKYYSYFGAAPVILLNIPYKLLTGENFSNSWSVCVFCILFAIGAFLLVGAIIKRWFSSTPYYLYLILTLCFIAISGVISLLTMPLTYEVPFASALAFITFALYFWISAAERAKARNIRLCLGSFCAALTAGCRPQFLLAVFLAIPLLWAVLIPDEKRKGAWRERIPAWAAFAIPFVAVAIPVMYYNYIRFESVFDFGAAYNLTSNDMTRRSFVAARIPHSLWMFFFQPANLSIEFPYFLNASGYTGIRIKAIVEPTYGGVFNHILLLLNIFLYKFRAQLKEKKLFAFSVMCVVIAFIMGIFDAQYAGIVYRYFVDFSYLLCMSALIIALYIYEREGEKRKKYLRLFVCVCLIVSVCFTVLPSAKTHWRFNYNNKEPNIYYEMKNAAEFWQ